MPDDFGPYGKGLSGYVHYMQAMDEAQKGGRRKPPRKGGCLPLTLFILTVVGGILVCLL